MAKINKKLSASVKEARKAAKLERQKKYKTVFMNGKQVRVERPQLIEGIPIDNFISQNADPIWLQQNEMWEEIED
jgi:predicted proteasome-type protease